MWKLVQINIRYRVANLRSSLVIVYQVNYTFLFILNIPPLYTFFLYLPSGKGYLQTLLEKLTVVCWLIKCEEKEIRKQPLHRGGILDKYNGMYL